MTFAEAVTHSDFMLTEGGVVERINRDQSVNLDPHIAHAGLVFDQNGKDVLARIYREYLDIGQKYNLPFLTMAPTWRASPHRINQSEFSQHTNVNAACISFSKDLRSSYGTYANSIYVGGLIACKGDAYKPDEALSRSEAVQFHREQAALLAACEPDFIKAATLPSVSEALGIADAISVTQIPYILSFVVTKNGTVLDGTPISEAIDLIDSEVQSAPLFYMINCVHPSIFEKAILQQRELECVMNRILGLQANTSSLSPGELDNLPYLDTANPEEYGESMVSLRERYGLKVLGGCCGSDSRHILEIATRIPK